MVKEEKLKKLFDLAYRCHRCPLGEKRKNLVFGEGNPDARILLIGEAPGALEDKTGIPFVGPAGKLLEKILNKVELHRDMIYITNTLMCRPPGNRDPEAEELRSCFPFLRGKIKIIEPDVILALGRISGNWVTDHVGLPMRVLRKKIRVYRETPIPVICTFHPSFLLRELHRGEKGSTKQVFEDFYLAIEKSKVREASGKPSGLAPRMRASKKGTLQ